MIDRKKLALIHIVKKELELSDAAYRKTLREHAGVDSAKDLDDSGFRKLMNFLVRSRHYRESRSGMTLRQRLYLKHLAQGLEWTEGHLENFIQKYYHKPLEGLSRKEASKAVESLKQVTRHRKDGGIDERE